MPPRPMGTTLYQDRVLTNLSIAYQNGEFIADMIFPVQPVGQKSGKFFQYNKQNFDHINTERARGAGYPRVDWSGTWNTYSVKKYGLEDPIDEEEYEEAEEPINVEMDTMYYLLDRLFVDKEMRVRDLIVNNATSVAVAAGDKWDDPGSDPVDQVDTRKETLKLAAGVKFNTIIMPDRIFNKVRRHPKVQSELGIFDAQKINRASMAEIFEVDNVLVPSSMYNTAKKNQTAALANIWGNYVVFMYVPPRPGRKQVSFGYTYRYAPPITERYTDESIESNIIRVKYQQSEEIVDASCGLLFDAVTNAYA